MKYYKNYIKLHSNTLGYIYYRTLYIITFKITCDIEAHCKHEEVGQSKADAKVIQKSTQNLKIMLLTIRFLWSGQHVGRYPNKSLIPINHDHCIVNMYKINNISII